MKNITRFLTVILVCILCLNFLPFATFAAGAEQNMDEEDMHLSDDSVGSDTTESDCNLATLFFSSKSSKATEEDAREMTPAFSPDVSEYTLVLYDYESPSDARIYATLGDHVAEGSVIKAAYFVENLDTEIALTVTSGSTRGKLLSDSINANSIKGNTLSIRIGTADETVEAYRVNVIRKATLSSLVLQDQNGNTLELDAAFDRNTNTYTVTEPIAVDTVLKVIATATAGEEATVTVADTEVVSGTEASVTPVWDDNGEYSLVVTVGGENSEPTSYTIKFAQNKQEVQKLEIITVPNKTKYYVGDIFDPTGLVLKVTYADTTSRNIYADAITFSPSEALTEEDDHVVVSFMDHTVNLDITVSPFLEGEGTKNNPYKLKTQSDLQLLKKRVNEDGVTYEGAYFAVINDIIIPEVWEPIGTKSTPFSGVIDGLISESKNATITVPEGGLPLLGYIKDATVKNLNIYGKRIEGAGLINNYTGVGLSGNAVIIEGVRLLNGTQTLKSGLVASSDGNGYAHASAKFVVTIRECVIEDGVTIGYDGTQKQIGSFAGRVNGTIENCVSSATVKGTDYVGGILGTPDNALGTCDVKNCTFNGTVIASGSCSGGIVGGGYSNSTAPNGARPTVISCTVTGTVEGKECVGGIFGGDLYVAQTWSNVVGSIRDNTFTGKVSGQQYVGAIIGYLDSLNRYDTISGNTYSADCGAKSGIGFLNYLDTSYEDPTKMEGTTVFNTANGVTDCPTVAGCAWKANHNRTDDPLGKDADALCKMIRAQGDLNGDGQITNADAAQLLAIVTAGENEDLSVADLNGDGLITNADVAQLLQMVTAA